MKSSDQQVMLTVVKLLLMGLNLLIRASPDGASSKMITVSHPEGWIL